MTGVNDGKTIEESMKEIQDGVEFLKRIEKLIK